MAWLLVASGNGTLKGQYFLHWEETSISILWCLAERKSGSKLYYDRSMRYALRSACLQLSNCRTGAILPLLCVCVCVFYVLVGAI